MQNLLHIYHSLLQEAFGRVFMELFHQAYRGVLCGILSVLVLHLSEACCDVLYQYAHSAQADLWTLMKQFSWDLQYPGNRVDAVVPSNQIKTISRS